ncbi:MAG: FGGY-family carbohydrate kinase [Rhodospirillaceae bacterium]|nr:FGGY-family carbohydrate kinase [Rhodospirillaceae bacterium]
MPLFLGLDIGTTSTIGILIDHTNRVLATASCPVDLSSPHAGWAEEDPHQWWSNVCAIVPRVLETAQCRAADISAIGVTGMVPALVLLGNNDCLLRPSIQQSDGRSGVEVAEIASEVDPEKFLETTGNGINQQLIATKLRWLERHEPDVFRQISTIFGSYDFINWKLTGARSIEQNWALEAGFLSLETRALAPDLVALAHIDPAVLPDVKLSHEIVGEVTLEAAAATGLVKGIPVVAGCADHVASAYVAGVVEEGDILIKFGGAGDILAATSQIRPDPRLFTDFHIVPGLFMPNGCMASTGSLLNWFVAEIAGNVTTEPGAAETTAHARLDALAEDVPPGANGVLALPYFLGEKTPIHDSFARGTFTGMSLNNTMADMWRALLEGTCFGFRHHIEVMRDIGYPVRRILASDGGTASRVWMQIAADILGMPVQLLTNHPGSCLGAAWLAGMGTGAVSDWAGVNRFVGEGSLISPNPKNGELYDARYVQYRQLYERLRPLFSDMARENGEGLALSH